MGRSEGVFVATSASSERGGQCGWDEWALVVRVVLVAQQKQGRLELEVKVASGLGHQSGAVMRPSMASGPAGRRSWIGAPSRFVVREISEKARKMEKGEIMGGGLACWWPPAELLAGDDGRRTEGEARGSVEGAWRGGAREAVYEVDLGRSRGEW